MTGPLGTCPPMSTSGRQTADCWLSAGAGAGLMATGHVARGTETTCLRMGTGETPTGAKQTGGPAGAGAGGAAEAGAVTAIGVTGGSDPEAQEDGGTGSALPTWPVGSPDGDPALPPMPGEGFPQEPPSGRSAGQALQVQGRESAVWRITLAVWDLGGVAGVGPSSSSG